MPTTTAKARFFEPMLLLATNSLPDGNEWEYELKLDGYRAIAFKSNGKVHLRSRNNKDFAVRYRAIASALQKLPDETVIDGEVVAFDESGRPSFNTLQNFGSSTVPIFYYAFDQRGDRPFFVFRRQEIPDPHAESLHRRIAVPGVVRMRFRVENGRGKNRIAEMFHPGVFSMDSSVVFGIAR
jgi:hypothetical protein